MNTALWIAAWVMSAGALIAGATKAGVGYDKLAAQEAAAWTRSRSPGFVETLGVLELLAAVGFVAPALVDVAPVLVPVTATCWVVLMIGATLTHVRLGQGKLAVVTLVYLAIALFIAVGRFGPQHF